MTRRGGRGEEPSQVEQFTVAQLRACRAHTGARRVYLNPPAVLEPGERTGHYRPGTDTLLLGADGESRIGAEDLAVAVPDELRAPATDRHSTVVHATG